MKKILYILPFLSIGIFFSCGDDFLDVTPRNELTDASFWKTEEDATLALNGCYRLWEAYANICLFDGASDNGYEKSNFGFINLANGTLTAANYNVGGSWIDWFHFMDENGGGDFAASANWFPYKRIHKYNSFLANIDNVTMDDDKKLRYIAEVRFLRAYDYFWKIMLHGDMPLVTRLINADEKLSRDPVATIEQFILDELTAVIPDLPIQNTINSEGHVTRGAAYALKARMELMMGNFADAQTDAKAVIDMPCYELFPDYRGLFLEANEKNKEAILNVQYIVNDYEQSLTQISLPAGDGGWSALNASKSMVDAYECSNGKTIDDPTSGYDIDNPFANRDPRLEMTILHPGQLWHGRYYNTLDQYMPDESLNPDYNRNESAARTGMNVIKYINSLDDSPGGWPPNFGGDIMVFRLAEMYLTFAEAAVETGVNKDLALIYINDIRARSGQVAATVLTRELVRRERRVELAFEGLRYLDIKRWDLGPQVLDGPLYGSRRGTMDYSNGHVTWAGNGADVNETNYIKIEDRVFNPERKYLFPIPQAEIDANPNMVQNPGY
jgi:starch-binding outer membrane protein, SusD/RagB family